MVTMYMHVQYQISRINRFWVRAESVATNCPTKMGADCRRGGAINCTCDYFDSYPCLNCLYIYIHCRKCKKKTLIIFVHYVILFILATYL